MTPAAEVPVRLLLTSLGNDHVFDDWLVADGFSGWRRVVPVVRGLDPQCVMEEFYNELVSEVSGRRVWLVAAGDASHLGVDLLGRAAAGGCVLIDPPVAALLSQDQQDEALDSGLARVTELDVLGGPLQEIDQAIEMGVSEEDRLRILISALEEGDLPGDAETQAEIRSMLGSYMTSLDDGADRETVELAPWWETAAILTSPRRLKAYFSAGRILPDRLPAGDSEVTRWPQSWWRSPDVPGRVSAFFD